MVSSYRVAASLITSKFLEHNTENEKFEKSRVLQKCLLMHITLIIITDRYSKLTKSSYRYCFPHCSFFEKNAF